MAISQGTMWPWYSCVEIPEGWAALPYKPRYLSFHPIGIVALRAHENPPVVPNRILEFLIDKANETHEEEQDTLSS